MPTRSLAKLFRPHLIAVLLGSMSVGALHAQTVPDAGTLGLKYAPDPTAVLELPLFGRWGMRSSVGGLSMVSGLGLKLGLAGTYDWDLGKQARLALAAGVVNVGRPELLPGLAVGIARLRFGGGTQGVDTRDMNFDVSLDWRYSNVLTLSTGVGISYSLVDPMPATWQAALRPSSSAGYVGLKYRF